MEQQSNERVNSGYSDEEIFAQQEAMLKKDKRKKSTHKLGVKDK